MLGGHACKVSLLGEYVHIANGMVSGMDRAFRWEGGHEGLNSYELEALVAVVKGKDIKMPI